LKVKQQTLQSFEFVLNDGDSEKFISYMKQNSPLLKGNVVILNGEGELRDIEEYLTENNFCFFRKSCELSTRKKSVVSLPNMSIEEALETIKQSEDELSQTEHTNRERTREVIEKPIRSGSYIKTDNDLTILSQINGGSEIDVSGNLEIFGTINGKVECGGAYMLLRDIGDNGVVIFNGVILEREKFKSRRAKLLKLNSEKRLIVEEL
jgi:septum site-determining protein MinC